MNRIFIIIFLLFVSCNLNKQDDSSNNKQISQDTVKKGLTFNGKKVKYVTKHKNGRIRYIILEVDSLNLEELHLTFYENGQKKEEGFQGRYNSFGTPVGDWVKYDSLGRLIEKTHYEVGEFKEAYKEITFYYTNGKIKEIQK